MNTIFANTTGKSLTGSSKRHRNNQSPAIAGPKDRKKENMKINLDGGCTLIRLFLVNLCPANKGIPANKFQIRFLRTIIPNLFVYRAYPGFFFMIFAFGSPSDSPFHNFKSLRNIEIRHNMPR
jgi:hypothetical protein